MQVGTRVDFPSQRPGKQRENSANPPKDRHGKVTPCTEMKISLLVTSQIKLSEKKKQIPQTQVDPGVHGSLATAACSGVQASNSPGWQGLERGPKALKVPRPFLCNLKRTESKRQITKQK